MTLLFRVRSFWSVHKLRARFVRERAEATQRAHWFEEGRRVGRAEAIAAQTIRAIDEDLVAAMHFTPRAAAGFVHNVDQLLALNILKDKFWGGES